MRGFRGRGPCHGNEKPRWRRLERGVAGLDGENHVRPSPMLESKQPPAEGVSAAPTRMDIRWATGAGMLAALLAADSVCAQVDWTQRATTNVVDGLRTIAAATDLAHGRPIFCGVNRQRWA